MSWIFKNDNGTYLHDFRVGLYGRIEEVKWAEHQSYAWRFSDRNAASVVTMKIGAAGHLVTLTPGGFNKRLAEIEKSNREVRSELAAALTIARTVLLPTDRREP